MSELLHHGDHPDADQLSAFAEHVLPDHERLETLAHLSECADCRQIVFLAQRAQDDDDRLPRAVPSRSNWWKNWHNLWPVAAVALACVLLVVVFLGRRHPTDLSQRSNVELESRASAPPSQAQAPQPVTPAPSQLGAPLSSKFPAAKAASSLHSASALPHSVDGTTSVNGDLAADRLKNDVFSRKASATDQQSANALAAGSQAAGGAIGTQAALSQEQKDGSLTEKREQTAALQSQRQLFSQPAAAGPRSLSEQSQSNTPQSTNQTVEVTSAPIDIQTENAVVSSSVFNLGGVAQAKSVKAPLPSKRFAASSISNGLKTLAVDSGGDLFLSKDAGKSWQRIPHQWAGKAIRVGLASPSSLTPPSVPRRALPAGATASTTLKPATPIAAPPGVGFELTTDAGATWSSPDGLVWKLK